MSGIDDGTRREVARNLRALDDSAKAEIEARMGRLSNVQLASVLVSALGLCAALDAAGLDTETGGDFFALMADLIDRPTCTMTECRIDHGSVSWGVRCSRCNDEFEHAFPNEFNWCPNCGAEVVE